MNKVNKGGRAPASEKTATSSDFSTDEFDINLLKIDAELRAELDEQGLVPRWINAKSFIQGGNFHRAGWRPYKRDPSKVKGALDFGYGASPEGYIQRNDLVLAVKKVDEHERYKAHIQRRADIMSGVNRNAAQELREKIKSSGVKAKIFEGYEDNE